MRSIKSIDVYEIDKIKGSRFIAYAFPVQSIDTLSDCLAYVYQDDPHASHYCWAYQGSHQDDHRYSDDGEPSGTAGKPILQVLQGLMLSNTLVIVVRYFGGTKLGTGGLARAYAQASKAVLQHCEILDLQHHTQIDLKISYSFEASFQHLLKHYQASCLQINYSDQVQVSVQILTTQNDDFIRQVTEKTAGRAHISCSDPYWA